MRDLEAEASKLPLAYQGKRDRAESKTEVQQMPRAGKSAKLHEKLCLTDIQEKVWYGRARKVSWDNDR
jgi:hypothetical protein